MTCTIEKPLGGSIELARELAEVARQTGTPHMVSVNRRHWPMLVRALQWAKDRPENTQSFDEVRELIKWQMLKRKQRLAFNAWVNSLKNQANIKIDKKALGVE